ncbi:MAG: carbon storage regulator CsrA [Candidatus Paracaedibacteraceae bacterium]|nr:carbon storage regulator CsrA [Candidatus Paracaedibacteraceae bacterium]
MLFLTRKIGESIIIDDEITLTVSEIRGSIVKLSFDYPKTSRILRKEIHDRIQQENKNAAAQADKIKQYLSTTHSSEISSSSASTEPSPFSTVAAGSDRRAAR